MIVCTAIAQLPGVSQIYAGTVMVGDIGFSIHLEEQL